MDAREVVAANKQYQDAKQFGSEKEVPSGASEFASVFKDLLHSSTSAIANPMLSSLEFIPQAVLDVPQQDATEQLDKDVLDDADTQSKEDSDADEAVEHTDVKDASEEEESGEVAAKEAEVFEVVSDALNQQMEFVEEEAAVIEEVAVSQLNTVEGTQVESKDTEKSEFVLQDEALVTNDRLAKQEAQSEFAPVSGVQGEQAVEAKASRAAQRVERFTTINPEARDGSEQDAQKGLGQGGPMTLTEMMAEQSQQRGLNRESRFTNPQEAQQQQLNPHGAGQQLSFGSEVSAAARGSASTGGGEAVARSANTIVLDSAGKSGEKATSKRNHAPQQLVKQNQSRIIEKVQQVIEKVAQSRDSNSIVVRLDPPSLGTVHVKLTQRGDELFGKIMPEGPEVEALLKSKMQELTQVLQASGLKADNIHVTIGHEQPAPDSNMFQNMMERRGSGGSNSGGSSAQGGEDGNLQHEGSGQSAVNEDDDAGWVA